MGLVKKHGLGSISGLLCIVPHSTSTLRGAKAVTACLMLPLHLSAVAEGFAYTVVEQAGEGIAR
jgi:hypothetical protein